MKRKITRIISVLCVAVTVFSAFVFSTFAAVLTGDDFEVILKAGKDQIKVGENLTLSLTVNVAQGSTYSADDFEIVWASDDASVCAVSTKGLVTGNGLGTAQIRATVTRKADSEVRTAYCTVHVIRNENAALDLFKNRQILGYRYSYNDDYFYTDDKKCWQSNYGFLNAFDKVCPYILLEYDYIRTHFDYDGKSWMIQLWKGQYGLVFFGSEIGVYYRDKQVPEDEISVWTHYKCAKQEDKLMGMQQTLYWDEKNNGEFVRQFTTPYDKYWWCTGFVPGHLWQTEPADELKMEATIDLLSDEMAQIFAARLEKCGFEKVRFTDKPSDLDVDSFCINGNRVNLSWQNISEAESSVMVKATIGSAIVGGGFFLLLGFAIVSFFSMILMLFLI